MDSNLYNGHPFLVPLLEEFAEAELVVEEKFKVAALEALGLINHPAADLAYQMARYDAQQVWSKGSSARPYELIYEILKGYAHLLKVASTHIPEDVRFLIGGLYHSLPETVTEFSSNGGTYKEWEKCLACGEITPRPDGFLPLQLNHALNCARLRLKQLYFSDRV